MKDRGRPPEQHDRTLLSPLSSEELKALREARRQMQERRKAAKKGPDAHRIVLGPEPEEAGLGEAPTRAMPALPSFEGDDDSLLRLRTGRTVPASPPMPPSLSEVLAAAPDQTLSDRPPMSASGAVVQPQPPDAPRTAPSPEEVEPSEAPTPVPQLQTDRQPPQIQVPELRTDRRTPPASSETPSLTPPDPSGSPPAGAEPRLDTMWWMNSAPLTAAGAEDEASPPGSVEPSPAPISDSSPAPLSDPAPAPAPKRSWLAISLVLLLILLLAAAAVGFMLQNRPRGILVLRTQPTGSTLHIDGQPYEERTPLKIDLPEGEHELLVEHAAYQPQRVKLRIEGGQNLSHTVTLRPAPPPGLIDVSLKLAPVAARVSVDGQPYYPTTLLHVPSLNPNDAHQFVISAPGYLSQTLDVKPGELKPSYEVTLKKSPDPSAAQADP